MTTTTTNAATENKITVESARANGLSMEEFFAANAGLTVEQYRAREEEKARKAEETAKAYALQAKIDTCKSTINFYDEKSRRAAWYLYNAVIKGDEDQATFIANDIAEFENKIAEAKKELADLEPATEETAAEDKAEEKNFTANCYYTYTKDDGEWNGSQSKNFATATEAANWIINLVRDNGYTLTDGNIRDWNTHKRYFLTETDFNAVNAQTKVTAAEDKVESYKLTKEQIEKRMSEIAIERGEFYDALEEAEADEDISQSHIDYLKEEIDRLGEEYNELWTQLIKLQEAEKAAHVETDTTATVEDKPVKKATVKIDRLDELKAEKSSLISAISHSLENHFIKLDNGEFVNASDAGFTTIGIDSARPEFDKLYFKDDSGEYVEVSKKAIDALHRLEVWFSYNAEAIKAEIAKTKFKFEVGKWYASDETGNVNRTYRVFKRTACYVTIYDPDIDDWNDLNNYDPGDEIDGEFDCIFRKKIQYDERGEYVDWRDDDGELVTLCAKDETDKPVDDDDPKDEIDDTEDEIDAAEDSVEAESVNDEKPEHTTDDFSAKLAELKAERDAKQVALIKAQDEHKQASEALQNCLSNIAAALNQKLNQLPLDYTITLKKVSGSTYRVVDFSEIYIGAYHIGCDVEFHFENWKGKTIARYDTPEQVETVINMLKAAIERGDKEFTFPTVDELNQPTTAVEEPADESEPTEVKHGAKFIEGKFYNDMDWATFGAGKKCCKILKRTACYVTIGDYSPYWKDYLKDDRYKIKTDSDGNEYINYWSGERLCAKFLTVDEHIRDSLKRAAEIAQQKYREYERDNDEDGMLREIELYSICTDAIKEMEVA